MRRRCRQPRTVSNAKLFKVPLTKNYAHDVKTMVSADPHAGLMYICNPNNPTARRRPAKTSSMRSPISRKDQFCWSKRAYAARFDAQPSIENSQNGAYLRRTRCDSSLLRKDAPKQRVKRDGHDNHIGDHYGHRSGPNTMDDPEAGRTSLDFCQGLRLVKEIGGDGCSCHLKGPLR